MSEEEHRRAEALSRASDCPTLSDYARNAVLGKPVVLWYRNDSLDQFVKDMVPLRKELNAIGTNFNQAVRRLHTLKHGPDIQQWILLNEEDKTRLFRQIDTISTTLQQAYQLWSRELKHLRG